MSDETNWEKIARDAAMALPPSDYGSHRAVKDVARLLREAYWLGIRHVATDGPRSGREAADKPTSETG